MLQRQTRQKQIILEALPKLNHPTATAVYEYIHGEYPTVSRATVFRVLKQAEENGRIMRLSFAGGEDRFDYNAVPHYHVRCAVCGKVCDVKMPFLYGLDDEVEDACGFTLQTHDIEFKGFCAECRAASGAEKAVASVDRHPARG